MSPIVATAGCLLLYFIGFWWYSRFLAQKVFALREDHVTPAHVLRDDIDYVPTNRYVLFGHHYASITGLAPMLGPAIAVIWGWVPAMLWVVLGAVLIGCVHDFGALVVSMRARGQSIGKVAESIIGVRAKTLLHAIIFFGISLAMGVFVSVIALLLRSGPGGYPQAVLPSGGLMLIAVAMGLLVFKAKFRLGPLTIVAFLLTLFLVWMGERFPTLGIDPESWPSPTGWSWILLAYAFAASVLPVWSLLQPRDFVNSLLLYLGIAATYIGFFFSEPVFAAPAFDPKPDGAPPIFPFVFIVIACGAASGFHSLVASGTTAKQINKETDGRMIGYGGMIGESLLGLMAVLACTAGFANSEAWHLHYHDWGKAAGLAEKLGAFVSGSARFIETLGVPLELAQTFIAMVTVSFALTTLDSATRLLRFNIAEISETLKFKFLGNRLVSSLLAVAAIGFFAFYKVDGRSAGLALWELFGTTNQLLAALALLVVSLYLRQRARKSWPYSIPMIFMFTSTLTAMSINMKKFADQEKWLLFGVGGALLVLAFWLAIEAILSLKKPRDVEGLDIES